jgi:hypothetical protein
MGNGRFTNTAWLAFPVIDKQTLLEITRFAIGFEEVTKRSAALGD